MKQQNTALVITSINNHADAFAIFDNLDGFDFILVGDRKGPSVNPLKNGRFLGISEQSDLDFKSSEVLPFNHYCRKNLGYLYAMKHGYETIFETDDDNFPVSDFPPELKRETELENISSPTGYVNIYSQYTDLNIWPRGFPLSKINEEPNLRSETANVTIGVWQGLANLDPDVDAINRLVFNYTDVRFEAGRYAIGRNCFCPFNSQNTTWYREAFPLMYLPCTVPFRMTDILRSFVAQRIMWESDSLLGFHEATVEQARNEHDLMHDFKDEQSMYLDTEGINALLLDQDLSGKDELECLAQCYSALIGNDYVDAGEQVYLNAWLNDVKTILSAP
jgi:hypothetical protein